MTDQTTTIPKGWKMTTLGEVAEKIVDNRGKTPPIINSGFELLEVNAISENQRTPEYSKVTKFVEEEIFNNWFRAGNILESDILIPTVGTIGNVSFSKLSRGSIAQNLIVFRTDKNKADPLLVYYLLKTPYYRNQLLKLDIGGVQPSIKVPHLLRLEINLPPFPEQCAIAAVLSSFDDKIELLREQNKTLEAIAQTIFKEWFVNFNFPGADGKPYKTSGGKMIDSELGEIPEGWRVGKIKDLIDILSGFAFSSSDFSQNGEYKLITIKNVQNRYFDTETKDRLSALPVKMPDYCKLEAGDILLSLTGNVGRICIVNGDNFLLNQRVAKLKERNPSDYAFTYLLFLQDSIFSLLQSTASGTAQQNLSPIQTKEIKIIIADRKILDQFGMVANKLIQKVNDNNSQIQTLSKLRDTLLPKLMKGDIRVKGFND